MVFIRNTCVSGAPQEALVCSSGEKKNPFAMVSSAWRSAQESMPNPAAASRVHRILTMAVVSKQYPVSGGTVDNGNLIIVHKGSSSV